MNWRTVFSLWAMVAWVSVGFALAASKLEPVSVLPDGLSKEIAAALDSKGLRMVGEEGPVCTIWLVKEVPTKPDFKPTLSVKYPLAPGELLGVLQVQSKGKFTDFRGQEIKAGVYTLRYGQQPEDGNHVGTSDLADFLLALPAAIDTDPKPIGMFDTLSQRSAKSAGSTHPAIFSLLPTEKPTDQPQLTHDADKDHTILSTVLSGKGGQRVPLRLVVIGKSGE